MLKDIIWTLKRVFHWIKMWPKIYFAKKQLRRLRKDKATTYFVCPHGIGDTLFLASMVHVFKEQYQIASVCLIVKTSHADIPDFFDGVDKKIVSNKMVDCLSTYARAYKIFSVDNFRFGHFILDFNWPEPGQLLGIKGMNLIDVYKRCVMRVPLDAKIQYPQMFVTKSQMDIYQAEYGAAEKVVVLMPYAVTVKRLPDQFWEMLVKNYQRKGYKVYTNIKDKSELPVSGSDALCLTLKEFYVISKNLGWECVALRSGICDLLGFSDIPLTVVHENALLAEAWNMKNLNLPNKRMRDFVLPENINDPKQISLLGKAVSESDWQRA